MNLLTFSCTCRNADEGKGTFRNETCISGFAEALAFLHVRILTSRLCVYICFHSQRSTQACASVYMVNDHVTHAAIQALTIDLTKMPICLFPLTSCQNQCFTFCPSKHFLLTNVDVSTARRESRVLRRNVIICNAIDSLG